MRGDRGRTGDLCSLPKAAKSLQIASGEIVGNLVAGVVVDDEGAVGIAGVIDVAPVVDVHVDREDGVVGYGHVHAVEDKLAVVVEVLFVSRVAKIS